MLSSEIGGTVYWLQCKRGGGGEFLGITKGKASLESAGKGGKTGVRLEPGGTGDCRSREKNRARRGTGLRETMFCWGDTIPLHCGDGKVKKITN